MKILEGLVITTVALGGYEMGYILIIPEQVRFLYCLVKLYLEGEQVPVL